MKSIFYLFTILSLHSSSTSTTTELPEEAKCQSSLFEYFWGSANTETPHSVGNGTGVCQCVWRVNQQPSEVKQCNQTTTQTYGQVYINGQLNHDDKTVCCVTNRFLNCFVDLARNKCADGETYNKLKDYVTAVEMKPLKFRDKLVNGTMVTRCEGAERQCKMNNSTVWYKAWWFWTGIGALVLLLLLVAAFLGYKYMKRIEY